MDAWFTIKARGTDTAEIAIFGDIGFGYSAADFYQQLNALGKGIKKLAVSINSAGGDVFQGFQIYNMLKRYKGDVSVTVDGLAASMASVIAMAGDERIMPENAMLMIHNPIGGVYGGKDEIASFAEALGKMEDQIVNAYVEATGLSDKAIRSMMDKETWLSADEAVSKGFADTVEKPVKMAAKAYNLGRFHNVPASFGAASKEDVTMSELNEQVKRICALAGKPDLADGFIKDKKSIDDVMAALDKAKADDATAKAAAEATARAKAAAEAEKKGENVSEADVRAKLLAEQNDIRALCKLAGMPDKAEGFISAGKSKDAVIAALADAKEKGEDKKRPANAKRDGEINSHHNSRSDGQAQELDTGKIWDNWNKPKKAAQAA